MTRVAEASPREPLPVELRSPDMELTDGMRQYALEHIAAKLQKHVAHIQSVIIRFEKVTGANHGVNMTCRIEVLLARHAPVVVHETNHDLRAAMDLAADRLERAVQREVERGRDGGRRSIRDGA